MGVEGGKESEGREGGACLSGECRLFHYINKGWLSILEYYFNFLRASVGRANQGELSRIDDVGY